MGDGREPTGLSRPSRRGLAPEGGSIPPGSCHRRRTHTFSLVGDILTLAGEKVDENETQDGRSYYSERHFGTFQRAIKLPRPVDTDKVEADHRNGVVTITLRKSDAVRPKRIKVKVRSSSGQRSRRNTQPT